MALRLCKYYGGGLNYEEVMKQPVTFIAIAFDELKKIAEDEETAFENAKAKAKRRIR